MAKRGRPPKLDSHKRGQVLGVLAVGGSIATAAAAVGCCVRTIYNTAQRDPEFFDQLRNTRAMHEVKLLKHIDDAAAQSKYWRAAAWKLERLYPDRYRPQPQGMVTTSEMHNFVEDLMKLIRDQTDGATYDRIITHTNDIFDRHSIEAPGAIELALDRLAEEADEEESELSPADAA